MGATEPQLKRRTGICYDASCGRAELKAWDRGPLGQEASLGRGPSWLPLEDHSQVDKGVQGRKKWCSCRGRGSRNPGAQQSQALGTRRATDRDESTGVEWEAARRVDAVAPRLDQTSQGPHLLSHPVSPQCSWRTSVTPILQTRKPRLREEQCRKSRSTRQTQNCTQDFLTSERCSYTELACGLWGDLSGPYPEAGVDLYAVGTPWESSKAETAVGELRVTS